LGISRKLVTPPLTAAREARAEVFLVFLAGFAEMYLRVDDPREQEIPSGIQGFIRRRADLRGDALDHTIVAQQVAFED
jgi:hypothetical protein